MQTRQGKPAAQAGSLLQPESDTQLDGLRCVKWQAEKPIPNIRAI